VGLSELLGIDATLADLFRVGGATGVGIYALLWLIRRGDRLQRDNIEELKRQRDEWRERAEKVEQELVDLRDDLAKVRRSLHDTEKRRQGYEDRHPEDREGDR